MGILEAVLCDTENEEQLEQKADGRQRQQRRH